VRVPAVSEVAGAAVADVPVPADLADGGAAAPLRAVPGIRARVADGARLPPRKPGGAGDPAGSREPGLGYRAWAPAPVRGLGGVGRLPGRDRPPQLPRRALVDHDPDAV